MELKHAEVKEIYTDYYSADKSLSQFTVNLPEGVNNLDPLLMLEVINSEDTVAQKMLVTAALTKGKKVELMGPVGKIMGFTHNGEGSISLLFQEYPYLLQVLIDYGYALILKKLTPPSFASSEEVTEEEEK